MRKSSFHWWFVTYTRESGTSLDVYVTELGAVTDRESEAFMLVGLLAVDPATRSICVWRSLDSGTRRLVHSYNRANLSDHWITAAGDYEAVTAHQVPLTLRDRGEPRFQGEGITQCALKDAHLTPELCAQLGLSVLILGSDAGSAGVGQLSGERNTLIV